MGNFAQRFTKENRHHLEVEAIVAAELLRKMGVPELREVCTRWCKSQDFAIRQRNDKHHHQGAASLPRRGPVVTQHAQTYGHHRIAGEERATRARKPQVRMHTHTHTHTHMHTHVRARSHAPAPRTHPRHTRTRAHTHTQYTHVCTL